MAMGLNLHLAAKYLMSVIICRTGGGIIGGGQPKERRKRGTVRISIEVLQVVKKKGKGG
jgi:hypothetical protein